jgi:hypothetical protein
MSAIRLFCLVLADHPSNESYRLCIGFVISELILNGQRPESLIRESIKVMQNN